ncbi:hypothetical protein DPMN_181166 [Dreissena polymorpha]|uniref:Uncharacterized protein n=1 Tax=Dreissena polymorpha TaxID=45954 RepID=A0A9D4DDB1_DREPO|nr:hypothetical protein DPMN_181166 [Dreissena polymorpha]
MCAADVRTVRHIGVYRLRSFPKRSQISLNPKQFRSARRGQYSRSSVYVGLPLVVRLRPSYGFDAF